MILLLFPLVVATIEIVLTLLCIGPAVVRSPALAVIGFTRTKALYLVTRTVYGIIVVFAFDVARQVYYSVNDSRPDKVPPFEELLTFSICVGTLLIGGLLRSLHMIHKKYKQLDASHLVMKKQAEATSKEYMRKLDESSPDDLHKGASKTGGPSSSTSDPAMKDIVSQRDAALAALDEAKNESAKAQGSSMALQRQVEGVMAEMERLQAENKKLRNLFTGEREEDLKEVDEWNKKRLQEHKRL